MQNELYIKTDNLVGRCLKGESKAQFEFYNLYCKNMYNTSFRILLNSTEAEDVVHESFFSAFDKLHTFSGQVTIGAWLKRIVINKSLDVLKRRKVDFTDIGVLRNVASENMDEDVDELQLKVEKVKDCIKKLPENHRLIITLNLIEGYDHEEIADILKITESTSRSQLSRAKKNY